jgi:3-oxoacyl-[acyl-carrier-protein] synthase-3
MLSTRSAKTVLLVGADNYLGSKRRELEGITLLGDGSSAVIIKSVCDTNRLIAISTFNEGSFYKGYYCDTPEKERFNLLYFLATTRIIQKTLHEAKLTMDDISVIIPHNINVSSWSRILKILKCDEKKFFSDNISQTGHVFGSDLVVNLTDAVSKGRIAKGEYALLVTAGLGAAWGCAIIQH